jgi:hypothetical protein
MGTFDNGLIAGSESARLISFLMRRLEAVRKAGADESSPLVVALKEVISDLEAGWLPGQVREE